MRLLATLACAVVLAACGDGGLRLMTMAEARDFTRRALSHAGVDGAEVAREVSARRCGDPEVGGWVTTAAVAGGGSVELCVEGTGVEAASVRDEGPDGGPLLSDEQVARLDSFRYDPRKGDSRAGAFAVATALLVAVVAAAVRLRTRLAA